MDGDTQLLHAWRGGDSRAGEELTARHYGRVRRFFEARAAYASQDLTQATFLACLEGLERYREDASFKTYLFAVARRQLLMHLRRQLRDDFDRPPQTNPTPSRVASMRQEQRLLMQSLEMLPVDQQLAVQLHYWEEMRCHEIAEVLGISTTAVTSRLSRARQSLRDTIQTQPLRPAAREVVLCDFEGWLRTAPSLAAG